MDQEQLSVVVFRLDQMETQILEVNKKLDQLLDIQQQYRTDVALLKQIQRQQDQRLTTVETKIENLQGKSTDLQISLAQKLGPGALAGAAAAVLAMILKFVMGV